MEGDDMGILIGKRGQTLDSLRSSGKPCGKQGNGRLLKSQA
ncbi:MAG: KH domain-containing protein [Clostridium sp.]